MDSEPGEAAWYVHTQLDAVFWGISKSQFKDFLGMVRRSISEGSISNPSKDKGHRWKLMTGMIPKVWILFVRCLGNNFNLSGFIPILL